MSSQAIVVLNCSIDNQSDAECLPVVSSVPAKLCFERLVLNLPAIMLSLHPPNYENMLCSIVNVI
jgi:hypothetical protein